MDAKKSRIVLITQGGAGDVIAHTPTIRYFRKKYPDDEIVVGTTYSALFKHNPHIDKLVPLKEINDFYNEEIRGQNVRFVKKHFVYDAIFDECAHDCKCLPEFICKVYGAEYDGEKLDYFLTKEEEKVAETFIGQYRPMKQPIVLLQCTGAIASEGDTPSKTNNLKDLDVAKVSELVKRHKDKITFIQIGLTGEPVVEGAIDALGMPMREAIALIPKADSYIFIESLFAHCTNALQTTGVVIFQNTSAPFFGYSNNHNLSFSGGCTEHPCNRPVGALFDFLPGYRNPKTRQKLLWECPNQVCKGMPLEEIEKVLLECLRPKKGNPALEAARKTPPPGKVENASPSNQSPE